MKNRRSTRASSFLHLIAATLTSASFTHAAPATQNLEHTLQKILAVGPEGRGNADAASALRQLQSAGPDALPALLDAMNQANDLSVNWLRAAVETVASAALDTGKPLPTPALVAFIENTKNQPRARRLAFELLARTNPATANKLLPSFLNDPANELRRDAVQLLLTDAERLVAASDKASAITQYQKALSHARDVDQIDQTAKKLKDLGQNVDLQSVFGWVTRWKTIAPFDSVGGKGFDAVYPPETVQDPSAEYDGKSGKVKWLPLESKDEYGMVDFNKVYTPLKGAAGYAFTEIESPAAQPVELRLGCKNAWKVWVNGQFIFGRDEYHRGMEIDQYRLKANLKAGRNTLLVKICQNEQKEDWASEWEFQLRITDALGTPILARSK